MQAFLVSEDDKDFVLKSVYMYLLPSEQSSLQYKNFLPDIW